MFRLDRSFSQRNEKTGLMEWFFNAREGIYGPYPSKELADKGLKKFIDYHSQTGNDGGRSLNAKNKLSVVPLEFTLAVKEFDPKKKKKGAEDL